jgi:hypothetical protein
VGGPSGVTAALAAVMIITATYCAGRLAASGRWRRATEVDADAAHVVMGTAMAGMLLPQLSPFPGRVWAAVFTAGAAWFALQAIRRRRGRSGGRWLCSHPVPHLVESAAMIYMLVAVPAAPGQQMPMPGIGGADAAAGTGFPALAVVLAYFMVGYVIWTADRLASLARATTAAAARAAASQAARLPGRRAAAPALAPRLAACYKIAMGLTMGYMLVMTF